MQAGATCDAAFIAPELRQVFQVEEPCLPGKPDAAPFHQLILEIDPGAVGHEWNRVWQGILGEDGIEHVQSVVLLGGEESAERLLGSRQGPMRDRRRQRVEQPIGE